MAGKLEGQDLFALSFFYFFILLKGNTFAAQKLVAGDAVQFGMAGSRAISGQEAPVSQLLTVLLDTPK